MKYIDTMETNESNTRASLNVLRNQMHSMACHAAVDNYGIFANEKTKARLLKIAKNGKYTLSNEIEEEIKKHTISTDLAIITFDRNFKRTAWCFIFILDEIGVRMLFKISYNRIREKVLKNPECDEKFCIPSFCQKLIGDGIFVTNWECNNFEKQFEREAF